MEKKTQEELIDSAPSKNTFHHWYSFIKYDHVNRDVVRGAHQFKQRDSANE